MKEKMTLDYDQFRNLVTDETFVKLRQMTTKFNIFEVMRSTHTEIRHSNILIWLLNPYENHGCGDAFLRQLLLTISQKPSLQDLGFYNLYLLDIESVKIDPEWVPRKAGTKESSDDQENQLAPDRKYMDRIDILINIELKNQINLKSTSKNYTRIVIPIENKIRSKESVKDSGTQLKVYSDALTKVFNKDVRVIPIFLTPDGSDPTDSAWIKIDYEEVRDIINTVFKSYRNDMSSDKQMMIQQYLDLLRDHIVGGSDPEIVKLCRILQSKHMLAMDEVRKLTTSSKKKETEKHKLCQQIYNRNASVFKAYKKWQYGLRERTSDLLLTWMNNHMESLRFQINTKKKSSIEFVSPEMQKLNRELFGKDNTIVLIFVIKLNSNISIVMQINSHPNQELRKSVYSIFQKDNSELFRSTDTEKISETYTRIYTQKILTPEDTFVMSSDKEVLNSIENKLEEFFAENGVYKQIQRFIRDHMEEFLALKD